MLKARKKNRLEKFLYSNWYFFVTICTKDMIKYFWNIDVGADNIHLNNYGKLIEQYRLEIPNIYNNVFLDEYVVMPNHFHWILIIESIVGEDIIFPNKEQTGEDIIFPNKKAINNRPYEHINLSKIIKWFKQITSKQLHQSWLTKFSRQKSFYDHIIRNEQDLQRIQEYIKNNPYKRQNDEYYK